MRSRRRASAALRRARAARLVGGALCLALLARCTVSTPPFTDASGRVLAGSVARMEKIELGGVVQTVWFRGRDVEAPALVLLHGGPGTSETALFRHFDAALENRFLTVYWDQRGSGRSYHPGMPPEALTIRRMVEDLDGLVDRVCDRFGKDRVVLLGHSWGTILGTRYAATHPEKVSVYVGVGQIADFSEDERTSFRWALEQAERRGDRRALRALREMRPGPASVADELALGRWVERFGGALRGGLSTGALVRAALGADEADLADLWRFGAGNRFSLEALRPQYAREDLTRFRRFAVPVVFLLGRHDWHVPSTLAARYFRTLEAPCKRLVWFERSAHDPPFEEPRAFVRAMADVVLPLARRGCSVPPASAAPTDCGAGVLGARRSGQVGPGIVGGRPGSARLWHDRAGDVRTGKSRGELVEPIGIEPTTS